MSLRGRSGLRHKRNNTEPVKSASRSTHSETTLVLTVFCAPSRWAPDTDRGTHAGANLREKQEKNRLVSTRASSPYSARPDTTPSRLPTASPAVCAVPRAAPPAYMTRRQQPGDRCAHTNLPSAASRKGASVAPTSFLTPRRHWCHEEGRRTRHAQRTPDLKSIPMKTKFMEPRHDGRERR